MTEKLELLLLGTPEVRLAGEKVTAFRSAKTEGLLYFLAATDQPHTRATLAGLFWGQWSDNQAHVNLSKSLSNLRTLLGDFLQINRDKVTLCPGQNLTVDLHELRSLITPSGQLLSLDRDKSYLERILSIYRGDFLEGFYVHDAPEFEQWMLRQRAQWREAWLAALTALAEQATTQGHYDQAIALLKSAIAIEPWREELHRNLMLLYARMGRRAEAIAQYQACRSALARQLSVEPSHQTETLYAQIVRDQIETIECPTAPTAVQPPVPSLGLPPHNLPTQITPFVGREEERNQIIRQLLDPECRLLTLVGPGGMGKTRLAIKVAQQLLASPDAVQHFADGIFFVSLAHISVPSGIPNAIADATNYRFYGYTSPQKQILDFLADKSMLLILDNFEHLLGGVDFLADILTAAPMVTMLVTSREALKLQAEWFRPVAGLTLYDSREDKSTNPELSSAPDMDALQLFAQSAKRVRPNFSLEREIEHAEQICRLVDGMPLAIELAAAWLRVLPAARVAQEVKRNLDFLKAQDRNVPERHRSMSAVFEQTWQMLSSEEQDSLRRLSLFRGGFDQDAAEAVAGASFYTMASLVEKALLRLDSSGRYQIHELLRQFAETKLAESDGEKESRSRHADYYLRFVYERQDILLGPSQMTALDEIGRELENIRAGWMWAVAQREWQSISRAVEGLHTFFAVRSRYFEGQELLETALALLRSVPIEEEDAELAQKRATAASRLLASLGSLASLHGDYETARQYVREALQLAQNNREKAFALRVQGDVASVTGHRQDAEMYFQQSIACARAIEDLAGVVEALRGLADMESGYANYERARHYALEALTLSRQLSYPHLTALALSSYAWPTNCMGNYSESAGCWQECLSLHRQVGDENGIALALGFLGWCAWCEGGQRLPDAIAYHEQALAIYRRIGHRMNTAMSLGDLALALAEAGYYEQARGFAVEGLRLAQEIGHFDLDNYNLYVLAHAMIGLGDFDAAHRYLANSLQLSWQRKVPDHLGNALYYLASMLKVKASHIQPPSSMRDALLVDALYYATLSINNGPTWHAFKDRASTIKKELEATLPADLLDKAKCMLEEKPIDVAVQEIISTIE